MTTALSILMISPYLFGMRVIQNEQLARRNSRTFSASPSDKEIEEEVVDTMCSRRLTLKILDTLRYI